MRLFELDDNTYDEQHISDLIKRDCEDWLLVTKGNPVYRGIDSKNLKRVIFRGEHEWEPFMKIYPPKDRLPMNTAVSAQRQLDKVFKQKGFTALRSNSIFCSGRFEQATNYGHAYKIYPIGEFSFTWSYEVRDLFLALKNNEQYEFTLEIENEHESIIPNVMDLFKRNNLEPVLHKTPKNYIISTNVIVNHDQLAETDKKLKTMLFDNGVYFLRYANDPYVTIQIRGRPLDQTLYQFVNDKNFQNTNLIEAIKSGREILLHANSYYAVSLDLKLDLTI